jgi:ABC-type glycerol-3-phosphate transport system permease component
MRVESRRLAASPHASRRLGRTIRRSGASVLLHAFLIVGLIVSLFPFYWMIVSSLQPPDAIFVLPPNWFVVEPVWQNYLAVFEATNFATGFLNSTFVTVTKTIFILLFSAMGGFAFAKYRFPGREQLFVFLLATMMIPGIVTLIPVFMIIVRMGWVDTYQALIIPGLASAFGIFLMRQYMLTIPDELLDAARIDGAGDMRLFLQLALPIAAPALISLAIFTFFANWNDLFWPILIIRTKPHYTLPLAIMLLRSRFPLHVDYTVIFAASFLATLPTLLIFFVLQRYFRGDVLGGSLRE